MSDLGVAFITKGNTTCGDSANCAGIKFDTIYHKYIKILSFSAFQLSSGEPGPWTDWSECHADCSDKAAKGTTTRSRKIKFPGNKLEDEVQEVGCSNPCPLGTCSIVDMEKL